MAFQFLTDREQAENLMQIRNVAYLDYICSLSCWNRSKVFPGSEQVKS